MDDERLLHLSDEQWAQVEATFPQRRGQSGFERKISNRQAFEAVLHRTRRGLPVARPARSLRRPPHDLHALAAVGEKRRAPTGLGGVVSRRGPARRVGPELGHDRLDRRARPSARRRGTQKNGNQALGRSRGGLSTKIHAVSVSEHQVLEVILSGGQEGDAPVGEELLGEVLAYEEIKAVGGDRAYDSDAIRAMISAAGKEVVIPPRYNRLRPVAYDKEKYKKRNKAERLFGKLKGYRGVATRYDKLAAMLLGGVLAALLAISLRCIVNTP